MEDSEDGVVPKKRNQVVDSSVIKQKRGVADAFVDRRLSNEEKTPLLMFYEFTGYSSQPQQKLSELPSAW